MSSRLRELSAEVRELESKLREGGGAERIAKLHKQGKLSARERVEKLCDPGSRYQSRLYNPEFLRSKGLTPPEWLERPESIEAPLEEVV